MQEFFYTVLVIWLLWRIFGSSRSQEPRANGRVFFYQQNNTTHHNPVTDKKTEIKEKPVKNNTAGKDEGEYVDYEDIT